jgi:hypothetical protein
MWCLQSVLYHVMHSNCVMPCDTFNLFYIMWYHQTVYTIWYIQTVWYPMIPSKYYIPCDTFLNTSHGIKQFAGITWYKQHLMVLHGITQLEAITWFKLVWMYHMASQIPSKCLIPCDTFILFYTMWCLQSVLYHVMHSNCVMPCDTFNLFYIMHGIKQFAGITWYKQHLRVLHGITQLEAITWFKLVWMYHMASNSLKVSHGLKQFEGST